MGDCCSGSGMNGTQNRRFAIAVAVGVGTKVPTDAKCGAFAVVKRLLSRVALVKAPGNWKWLERWIFGQGETSARACKASVSETHLDREDRVISGRLKCVVDEIDFSLHVGCAFFCCNVREPGTGLLDTLPVRPSQQTPTGGSSQASTTKDITMVGITVID